MEKYQKIAVKNVCIVDICFRRVGLLYNEGRIVVDIDTYDFAGRITDDIIIGFYRDGKYDIHYYYKKYIFNVNPTTGMLEGPEYRWEEYKIRLTADFEKTTPREDFVEKTLRFWNQDDEFILSFEYIISDMQEIQKALEYNQDLLKPRI